MKKSIFTLLLMVVSMGVFAQMQVWSNGTIIFSHNANDVDSISFAGSPMKVQANMQAGSTSIAGRMYTAHSGSVGFAYLLIIDDNNAIITLNNSNYTFTQGTSVTPVVPSSYTYDPTTKAITIGASCSGYLTEEGCILNQDAGYGITQIISLIRVK